MTRRDEPSRRIDQPVAGFYALRLCKGGPQVCALIHHGAAGWSCSINNHATGFPNVDPWLVQDLWRIHSYGTIISHEAYLALSANPPASPDKKIDMNSEPPTF